MISPAALLAIFFFFGFNSPQIGEGCIATSSTGMPVTSSTAAPTTVSVTTTPTTASVTTTTPTTTTPTTTTSTTSITTVAAGSCSSCPQNLMQAPQTTDPGSIDGVAVISYTPPSMPGECIVPNIVCNTVGGLPYAITIALQENEGLLFGGGCATTAMPPGIVVCNAMGQWMSTVTNNIQPQIICSEANPATSPTC